MNSLLYAKLAKTNLSKNRQNILPYWLSCISTVIMFYIMSTLSLSEGLKNDGESHDSDSNAVWRIYHRTFCCDLSDLQQQFSGKTQEKRIWTVSDPWHGKETSCKGSVFESLYLWILSVGGGILLGILCYKLLFLVLLKLTRFQERSILFLTGRLQETRWFYLP